MERIDVVVPVRSAEGSEYQKLMICTRAIRARIPVSRLIMPSANPNSKTKQRISELADVPVFDENATGAGRCRNAGLREVTTKYFASIDADTAVRKEWYPWCIGNIRNPNVAACQGYSKPLSRLWDRYVRRDALDIGTYADLGNTLLRTDVVREIGIPSEPMLEDHILHDRMRKKGYLWLVNRDLISDHLLNEHDVLRHRYWYGKFSPQDLPSFSKYCVWLTGETVKRARGKYGLELSVFLMLADLAFSLGSLRGFYASPTQ